MNISDKDSIFTALKICLGREEIGNIYESFREEVSFYAKKINNNFSQEELDFHWNVNRRLGREFVAEEMGKKIGFSGSDFIAKSGSCGVYGACYVNKKGWLPAWAYDSWSNVQCGDGYFLTAYQAYIESNKQFS